MIDTSASGGVRAVTLARPDRRNALTPDGLGRLEAAVTGMDEPVVYFHGAGEAFCAGADLDVLAGLDREGAAAFARHGQRVADAETAARMGLVSQVRDRPRTVAESVAEHDPGALRAVAGLFREQADPERQATRSFDRTVSPLPSGR